MDALDQKLNSAFDGKVVRKDLLHRINKRSYFLAVIYAR
jgi:ATP-dependent Lon protease